MNRGRGIGEEEGGMMLEGFFEGREEGKGGVKGRGVGLRIGRDCIGGMEGEVYVVEERGEEVCLGIELGWWKKRK